MVIKSTIPRPQGQGIHEVRRDIWLQDTQENDRSRARRIDELVHPGEKDLHGDYGAYCYERFRHRLCHGWASGPTAWLNQHVLGIQPVAPGFARVQIAPQLGRRRWAEGAYPTPRRPTTVRHEQQADGGLRSEVSVPEGVEVVS